jgi:hypothetical protein
VLKDESGKQVPFRLSDLMTGGRTTTNLLDSINHQGYNSLDLKNSHFHDTGH